jgi:isoquinoline 1-oxidoreductase alpha subunit
MTAAGLLNRNPNPSEEQIVAEMSDVLCRCGTYLRIRKAVAKVAKGGK